MKRPLVERIAAAWMILSGASNEALQRTRSRSVVRPRMPFKEWIALALLASLGAMNVYRAATQSIVVDEARTYLAFVRPPLRQILSTYEANHHVLHSLLCKASTRAFGLSELSLRIPSLIGGFLCFGIFFLISRELFGSTWLMLFSVALFSLNRLVLDFCSAARGYSLALSLYLGVLLRVVFYQRAGWLSGVLLGLCLSANVTFLPPVLALSLFCLASSARRRRAWETIVAEIAVVCAICGGPFLYARRQDFWLGYGSIFESLKNFAVGSLYEFAPGHNLLRIHLDFFAWLYPAFRYAVLFLLAGAVVVCGRILAQRQKRTVQEQWIVLLGTTAVVSFIVLTLMHGIGGVHYPVARAVIYFWPIVVLLGCLFIARWKNAPPLPRTIAILCSLFFAIVLSHFTMHLSYDYYDGWLYDADTNRVAQFLRAETSQRRDVKITASAALLYSLNFYRELYGTNWRTVEGLNEKVDTSGEYVVADMYDPELGPDLVKIYQDWLSQARVYRHR